MAADATTTRTMIPATPTFIRLTRLRLIRPEHRIHAHLVHGLNQAGDIMADKLGEGERESAFHAEAALMFRLNMSVFERSKKSQLIVRQSFMKSRQKQHVKHERRRWVMLRNDHRKAMVPGHPARRGGSLGVERSQAGAWERDTGGAKRAGGWERDNGRPRAWPT
jgi:hypothetical protein